MHKLLLIVFCLSLLGQDAFAYYEKCPDISGSWSSNDDEGYTPPKLVEIWVIPVKNPLNVNFEATLASLLAKSYMNNNRSRVECLTTRRIGSTYLPPLCTNMITGGKYTTEGLSRIDIPNSSGSLVNVGRDFMATRKFVSCSSGKVTEIGVGTIYVYSNDNSKTLLPYIFLERETYKVVVTRNSPAPSL